MIEITCQKHKIGDPNCEDCWKALFTGISKSNLNLVLDESTKDLIDNAR
jgi:hypothetical protein